MEQSSAHELVRHWLHAGNGHDLDAVPAHFADAATFTPPVAAWIVAGSDAVSRGRQRELIERRRDN